MLDSIMRACVMASAAALICEMPPRVARYALSLLPMLGATGKRRVAPVDVVRLAVAARLLELGIKMPAAVDIVQTAVDPHLDGLATCGIDVPPAFMLPRLHGLVLDLAPRPEGRHALFPCPADVPPIRSAVVLRINVGVIAETTVRRLEPRVRSTTNRAAAREELSQ